MLITIIYENVFALYGAQERLHNIAYQWLSSFRS